jgi:hypothetical protein
MVNRRSELERGSNLEQRYLDATHDGRLAVYLGQHSKAVQAWRQSCFGEFGLIGELPLDHVPHLGASQVYRPSRR